MYAYLCMSLRVIQVAGNLRRYVKHNTRHTTRGHADTKSMWCYSYINKTVNTCNIAVIQPIFPSRRHFHFFLVFKRFQKLHFVTTRVPLSLLYFPLRWLHSCTIVTTRSIGYSQWIGFIAPVRSALRNPRDELIYVVFYAWGWESFIRSHGSFSHEKRIKPHRSK